MVLKDSEAIILRTHKLAEADKIVIFLSRRSGLVRGVARGARRLKSRFGAGLEPFTRVRISWAEKEERELVSISQVEIEQSYFNLSSRPEVVAVLEQMSAHTLLFAQPHQTDERLYRMVLACVEALKSGPEMAEAVMTYFELWLLKLSGFLPDLSSCGPCGRELFHARAGVKAGADGVLYCAACATESLQSLEGETVNCLIVSREEGPGRWAERLLLQNKFVRGQAAGFSRRLITRTAGLTHWKTHRAAPPESVRRSPEGLREDVLR
jgi:DNA repair protein RecO (recombination protein O)